MIPRLASTPPLDRATRPRPWTRFVAGVCFGALVAASLPAAANKCLGERDRRERWTLEFVSISTVDSTSPVSPMVESAWNDDSLKTLEAANRHENGAPLRLDYADTSGQSRGQLSFATQEVQ